MKDDEEHEVELVSREAASSIPSTFFFLSKTLCKADKIRFVINNTEQAKAAAEELHNKVKKYCNCEEYFEKLTSIYNELLNE